MPISRYAPTCSWFHRAPAQRAAPTARPPSTRQEPSLTRTGPRYAVFVSPHGFGHAARASAVMAELHVRRGARFEIFTTVPRWFFDEAVAGTYSYHRLACDVGFRQRSALQHDLGATVAALGRLIPFDDGLVEGLAADVKQAGCRAILCDIAPLGIAVAERAGLPSVLVESFSWQWLYRRLLDEEPGLARFADALERWWSRATLHVQAAPSCAREPGADLHVGPISRAPRRGRAQTRAAYGLATDRPLVLLTMGGVPHALPFLGALRDVADIQFAATGGAETRRDGNVLLFDDDTPVFTPDLMRAADALVAKLGYSTIAEAWREGIPAAFVHRTDSPEMEALRSFVSSELDGFEIAGADFDGGNWVARIPELLRLLRRPREADAARRVAQAVEELA